MPFCPSCGERVSKKDKFCFSCGANLPKERQQEKKPTVDSPEHKTKGLNWFKRHLDWTLGFAAVSAYGIAFGASSIFEFTFPTVPYEVTDVVFALVSNIIILPVALWVLRQKGRKLWWLFILFAPFGWIFIILLDNHGYLTKPKNEIRKRCLDYILEEAKVGLFRDKEANRMRDAVVEYAASAYYDSHALEQLRRAASRFAQSADEILKRRNAMGSVQEEVAYLYALWQVAYINYDDWAKAQYAATKAIAGGLIPDEKAVLRFAKNAQKSENKAAKEQGRSINRLRVTASELQQIITTASAAVLDDKWEPAVED